MIAGESLRTISGQFGPSKTAVLRHRAHVAETIARSTEARDLVRTGVLLDDVRAGERRAERLYEKAEEILTKALRNDDPRTALQAIRAASAVMGDARGYLELRGELTNELGRDRTPAAVSIQIISPAVQVNAMPRVVFSSPDQIEAAPEPDDDPVASIGVVQRP
jgi:hypothetical protein